MPARSYKTRAIVLRARNLGEADKIYTLFTQERGKLDAVAKGVRRANSRLAGRLEFMCESLLGMHRGRNLDVVTSADVVAACWTGIVDPASFATAHVIAELVDAFSEPDLALPDVYALLRGAIAGIAAAEDPARLIPRFELLLLGALGYAPEAETCVSCGQPLIGRAAWADLEAGGLACERCRPHGADGHALDPADGANFRALGAARGGRLRPAAHATSAVARAVDAFVTYHLGKRTKAGKVLDELAEAGTLR
ncbi:MAG: DNA repair protein RecO [Vulcanimicrobiaceae bacterium]